MRILFMGCVEASKIYLNELIKNKKSIVGVVTKNKSAYNADFCDLSEISESNKIPFFHCIKANDKETKEFIKATAPDIIFCCGWSELLDSEILGMAKYGVIGNHPAALPKNRGRHPIIWALVLGLDETASSFMQLVDGADEGDILSQEMIKIEYEDDALSLYKKINKVASKQIIQIVNMYENNKVTTRKNEIEKGNVWRKRGYLDGQIDWRMSSYSIYNLVRALTKPYGGAHFIAKDKEFKVWKAEEIVTNKYRNIEAGKILKVDNNDKSLTIKTGDNIIKINIEEIEGFVEGEYL